ncbi:MAG: hypothetical protein AAF206_02190 [Bacteroidota bacterium]
MFFLQLAFGQNQPERVTDWYLTERFVQTDRNDDGLLSIEEMRLLDREWGFYLDPDGLDKADLNRDGLLSRSEVARVAGDAHQHRLRDDVKQIAILNRQYPFFQSAKIKYFQRHPELTRQLMNNLIWLRNHPETVSRMISLRSWMRGQPEIARDLHRNLCYLAEHPGVALVLYDLPDIRTRQPELSQWRNRHQRFISENHLQLDQIYHVDPVNDIPVIPLAASRTEPKQAVKKPQPVRPTGAVVQRSIDLDAAQAAFKKRQDDADALHKQELRTLNQENVQLREAEEVLKGQVRALESYLKQVSDESAESFSTIDQQKRRILNLTQSRSNLEQQLRTATLDRRKSRMLRDSLQFVVDKQNTTIQQLEVQLSKSGSDPVSSDILVQMQSLQEENAAQQEKIEGLSQIIDEKDDELLALTQSWTALSRDLEKARKEVADLQVSLKKEIALNRKKAEKTKSSVAVASPKAENLTFDRMAMDSIQNRSISLEMQVANLQKRLQQAEALNQAQANQIQEQSLSAAALESRFAAYRDSVFAIQLKKDQALVDAGKKIDALESRSDVRKTARVAKSAISQSAMDSMNLQLQYFVIERDLAKVVEDSLLLQSLRQQQTIKKLSAEIQNLKADNSADAMLEQSVADGKMSTLSQKIQKLKTERNTLASRQVHFQDSVSSILSQKDRELDLVNDDLLDLQRENRSVTGQMASLEYDNENLREQLELTLQQLERTDRDTRQRLNQAASSEARLSRKVERLRKKRTLSRSIYDRQLTELENQVADLSLEKDEYKSQLEASEAKLMTKAVNDASYEVDVQSLREEIESLRLEKSRLWSMIDSMSMSLAGARTLSWTDSLQSYRQRIWDMEESSGAQASAFAVQAREMERRSDSLQYQLEQTRELLSKQQLAGSIEMGRFNRLEEREKQLDQQQKLINKEEQLLNTKRRSIDQRMQQLAQMEARYQDIEKREKALQLKEQRLRNHRK